MELGEGRADSENFLNEDGALGFDADGPWDDVFELDVNEDEEEEDCGFMMGEERDRLCGDNACRLGTEGVFGEAALAANILALGRCVDFERMFDFDNDP